MPRIDDILLETIFYIYPSYQDAIDGNESGGTGFFIQISSERHNKPGSKYAVSNSHVVFGMETEEVFLRINTKDYKFDITKTKKEDWLRHSNGDDLAICPIQLDRDHHSASYFKREHFINKEFIDDNNVGVGDDVIMIGRFRVHAGKNKNLPTAMFGCISQMPDESLYNQFTKCMQESFLVEMKSIKGFSGSPVILSIPVGSNRFDGSKRIRTRWDQRLLGIDWGQIPYEVMAKDAYDQKYKLKIDSAIAGVVPIWKVLDIIDSEEK